MNMTSKEAPTAVEPDFLTLTTQLADCDLKARGAAADAGQARAQRSTVAVSTIKAAFSEKVDVAEVRTSLLEAGVLKGTVSKICTILISLGDGTITLADVKSLNGAYNAVKAAMAARATVGSPLPVSPLPWPPVFAAASEPPAPSAVAATTPAQALKIIVDLVKRESDPDKALKLAGKWITKITTALSDAAKESDKDEEDE